jgi:hypothetical protein
MRTRIKSGHDCRVFVNRSRASLRPVARFRIAFHRTQQVHFGKQYWSAVFGSVDQHLNRKPPLLDQDPVLRTPAAPISFDRTPKLARLIRKAERRFNGVFPEIIARYAFCLKPFHERAHGGC